MKTPEIHRMPFSTDKGMGARARIGLLVLQTDQTLEAELSRMLALDDVAIYHARLANDAVVTPESLARMERELPTTARLIPTEFGLASIGYGCTSGTTLIGEARVQELINNIHPNVPSTNPLSAAKHALTALKVSKLALLTPYEPEVTQAMQASFIASGIQVTVVGSFYERHDNIVGQIDEASIRKAALTIGQSAECEGVFISCTSLRTSGMIEELEATLEKPVTASNHALAWHLLRLAGIDDDIPDRGQLFNHALAQQPL